MRAIFAETSFLLAPSDAKLAAIASGASDARSGSARGLL
jgi:hypothetical protein